MRLLYSRTYLGAARVGQYYLGRGRGEMLRDAKRGSAHGLSTALQ
jgi:hypothetical protein